MLAACEPLQKLEAEGVADVAAFSARCLVNGHVDAEKLAALAGATGLSADALTGCSEALSQILLMCCKRNCSTKDFSMGLLDLGLAEPKLKALSLAYEAHYPAIRRFLGDMSLQLPHYHNLDWRVDVELASRSQRQIVSPKFVLDLETRDQDDVPQHVVFQSDFAVLQEVAAQLEAAVQETRSKHSSRIQRYVK